MHRVWPHAQGLTTLHRVWPHCTGSDHIAQGLTSLHRVWPHCTEQSTCTGSDHNTEFTMAFSVKCDCLRMRESCLWCALISSAWTAWDGFALSFLWRINLTNLINECNARVSFGLWNSNLTLQFKNKTEKNFVNKWKENQLTMLLLNLCKSCSNCNVYFVVGNQFCESVSWIIKKQKNKGHQRTWK